MNVVMDYHLGGIGYALTKTAGTPLRRGLARELALIRVNAISPGPIDTWGMTKEEKATFIKQVHIKRTGQPLDVANAIRFLASSEASYITVKPSMLMEETLIINIGLSFGQPVGESRRVVSPESKDINSTDKNKQ